MTLFRLYFYLLNGSVDPRIALAIYIMSQEAVLDPMDQEILGEANSPEFTNGDNAQTDTVQRINAYSAGNGTLVHEDTSEDALQDTADKVSLLVNSIFRIDGLKRNLQALL